MIGSFCLTFSILDCTYFSWQKQTLGAKKYNRNEGHRT